MEALKRWGPVAAWAGFIFVLSSIPDLRSGLPTAWDLILRRAWHMAEFGILAWLLWRAWPNLFWAGTIAFFYAATDELHQTFVFGREGTLRDVVIDAVGIIIAILAIRWRLRRSS